MSTTIVDRTGLSDFDGLKVVKSSLIDIDYFFSLISKIESHSITTEEVVRFPWNLIKDEVSLEVSIRNSVVGNKIYNSKAPSLVKLVGELICTNMFHLSDFWEMSENWQNADYDITSMLILKIHEVCLYANQKHNVSELQRRFSNSGYPSWIAIKTQTHDM